MHLQPRFPVDWHDRRRIVGLGCVLFILLSAILVQFYRLQIIQGKRWTSQAEMQQQRIVTEPFQRGVFFSRVSLNPGHKHAPQPFVLDIQKFHLYIDPLAIPSGAKESAARKLFTLLDREEKSWKVFYADFQKETHSRRIAMWLDSDQRKTILEWWAQFAQERKIVRNALYFTVDFQRSYPFGKMLGQVLHTIREVKDETTKEAVPTGGMELQFNDLLKGNQGKRLLLHSPRSSLELGTVLEAPKNGASIFLTVDPCLQAIAEEEIAKGVQRAKAKGGWAILMNPHTGEILAWAQYPFFDPSCYRDYFNSEELIEHTRLKAITDAHEVGSVMKPVTVAICLQANKELQTRGLASVFDTKEKVDTHLGIFPGRKKPLCDTSLHSFLNMPLAIQKSSNIYMAKWVDRLVQLLGNEWYRQQLEESFGFGLTTGIELPGEVPGLLPRIGKKHPNGALEWSLPTPYSLAMGHNIQANSLQMLCAYAIFANGGYAVHPTLIDKIVEVHGEGIEEILYEGSSSRERVVRRRVLDPEVVEEVVCAMRLTTQKGGTATRANIWGYTEAGKTATAEKIVGGTYSKKHYFSSFIGFAPVKNARFVLLVAIDEPEVVYIPGVGKNHHGGHCAAPVFREIGKRTLEYMGVTPDDPHGYPVGDPRYDPKSAVWSEETRQLQLLYERWNYGVK